jgi:addiction module RelE/StbE family toxin
VEIVWSRRAQARLEEIRAYVAKDKPDAEARLATRIVAVVEALRNHPNLGHVGAEPGIRELVIGGTPYVVIYSVKRTRVTISAIWHAAQSRKKTGRSG